MDAGTVWGMAAMLIIGGAAFAVLCASILSARISRARGE